MDCNEARSGNLLEQVRFDLLLTRDLSTRFESASTILFPAQRSGLLSNSEIAKGWVLTAVVSSWQTELTGSDSILCIFTVWPEELWRASVVCKFDIIEELSKCRTPSNSNKSSLGLSEQSSSFTDWRRIMETCFFPNVLLAWSVFRLAFRCLLRKRQWEHCTFFDLSQPFCLPSCFLKLVYSRSILSIKPS